MRGSWRVGNGGNTSCTSGCGEGVRSCAGGFRVQALVSFFGHLVAGQWILRFMCSSIAIEASVTPTLGLNGGGCKQGCVIALRFR